MIEVVYKVGRRLQELRRARNLTQEVVAEKAGIAPHTLSRIERGQQAPSLQVLDRLATALDVSLATVVDFEGERRQPSDLAASVVEALPASNEVLRDRLREVIAGLLRKE